MRRQRIGRDAAWLPSMQLYIQLKHDCLDVIEDEITVW